MDLFYSLSDYFRKGFTVGYTSTFILGSVFVAPLNVTSSLSSFTASVDVCVPVEKTVYLSSLVDTVDILDILSPTSLDGVLINDFPSKRFFYDFTTSHLITSP